MARLMQRRMPVLLTAIALDLTLGEPPSAWHPVVWVGRAVRQIERRAPASGQGRQLAFGAAVALGLPWVGVLAGRWLQRTTRQMPGPLGALLEAASLSTLFAVRGLLRAAGEVRAPLLTNDVTAARTAVRSLVSRDPAQLDVPLIAAAAIESVAENLTDSALSPWLAYAVGGLPAAAAYRVVNTLDSMIGYRGRYEYLGKVSARLDDLLNLPAARLGAILISIGAPLAGGSPHTAWQVARRHHRRTASPNAGWTMAAMAGALDVTLQKVGAYRLGDGGSPTADDIRRAMRVAAGALVGGAVCACALAAVADGMRRGRRCNSTAARARPRCGQRASTRRQ